MIKMPEKAWGAEFTLTIGCRLDCYYCPQKKLINRYIEKFGNQKLHMSYEDFKICLSKLKLHSGIAIGGMSEPFQNKECAKMIKYAYEKGFSISLDTTLMGMTKEDFELIKDVKFSHFQLHIPDLQGNSKFILSEEYVEMFETVSENFEISAYSCHGKTHPIIEEKIDSTIPLFNVMMDRAGNLEVEGVKHCERHTEAIVCASGSTELTGWNFEVLPNGAVALCCMDYGLKHILGNLLKQEWVEIVEGEEFKKIERGMIEPECDILCNNCTAARDRTVFEKANLLPANAIHTIRMLQKIENNEYPDEKNINGELIHKLLHSKNRCVFGLGKLFKDNYFNSCWHEVIRANYLTDNNYKSEMEQYGIHFIEPKKLRELDDLLVIIFTMDSKTIELQLEEYGIENYVNIKEIYNLFYHINF